MRAGEEECVATAEMTWSLLVDLVFSDAAAAITCLIGVQLFCVRHPENAIFTQTIAMSATPDPSLVLSRWVDLFLDVINRHNPLKKKRLKHQTLPPSLNTDVKQAMLLRDKFRKQKTFLEYKQQRNRVNYLVREANKK